MGDSFVADVEPVPRALCAAAPNPRSPTPPPAKSDPPTAEAVFAALAGVRPADLVLAEETPSNLAMLHKHFPVRQRSGFFTMASGGLGFGLPGSIGVALGEQATGRNRPVMCVVGDGSFHYCIQSLATAAHEKARVTIVVPVND